MKYKDDIKKLIKLLGDSENISALSHCVSRIRLVVKDIKKINESEIKLLDSCKGTILLPNNQFHVIIGSDVETFYNEFVKISNLDNILEKIIKMKLWKMQVFDKKLWVIYQKFLFL